MCFIFQMNHGLELLNSGDADLGLEHLVGAIALNDGRPCPVLCVLYTPENFVGLIDHVATLGAAIPRNALIWIEDFASLIN